MINTGKYSVFIKNPDGSLCPIRKGITPKEAGDLIVSSSEHEKLVAYAEIAEDITNKIGQINLVFFKNVDGTFRCGFQPCDTTFIGFEGISQLIKEADEIINKYGK